MVIVGPPSLLIARMLRVGDLCRLTMAFGHIMAMGRMYVMAFGHIMAFGRIMAFGQ